MHRETRETVTLPWVALSSEEAVAALRRAGFVVRTSATHVTLQRGLRVVIVPADEVLDPNVVRRILRDAGIDYVHLLDNLVTPLPLPATDTTMKGDT